MPPGNYITARRSIDRVIWSLRGPVGRGDNHDDSIGWVRRAPGGLGATSRRITFGRSEVVIISRIMVVATGSSRRTTTHFSLSPAPLLLAPRSSTVWGLFFGGSKGRKGFVGEYRLMSSAQRAVTRCLKRYCSYASGESSYSVMLRIRE